MTRNEVVDKAFKNLRRTPRPGQKEVVLEVLEKFLDQKLQNVVLCLDTGAGKSIIAAAIGECLKHYDNPELNSVILMHQNSLTDQYYQTFRDQDLYQYFLVKGAKNYSCDFLRYRGEKDATGEECVKLEITDMERDKFCKSCEFAESRKLVNKTQNLITNYSYFMVASLVSGHMDPRNLHVFDEAHLLNDVYCSHAEIDISVEYLDKYIREANTELPNAQEPATALTFAKKDLEHNKITEQNYVEYIEKVSDAYRKLSNAASEIAGTLKGDSNLKKKIRMKRIASRYMTKVSALDEFLKTKYEHVFIHEEGLQKIIVKPVFIREAMQKLQSRYNLFMSATLSVGFAEETFGLDPKKTAYVTAPPRFPKENRPVFFLSSKSLNFQNMQEKETKEMISEYVKRITAFHENQKGLIMVPSFKLGSEVAAAVKGKIFEHKSRENLTELIKKFKEHKGQAVLVSPSLYEGLDFAGDSAEYQILVKTPFASLGDKRIKRILDVYPAVYSEMTLYKILQGMGRSVRSETDVGVSYFLDGSSKRLFFSPANLWKERYEVKKA